MASLAYLLPPLSGLIAYLAGSSERTRFHGLQAICFGVVWPAGLYGASAIGQAATQLVAAVGAVAWLVLLGAAAAGHNPRLPLVAAWLWTAAAESPRSRDAP